MFKHTVRKDSTLQFTLGDSVKVVRVNCLGLRGGRFEWEITGANQQPPLSSSYDLSFSFSIGDEAVILNVIDKSNYVMLVMDMSDNVRVKIISKKS